jgi:HPt (histidine-containing phosphotransfer) domain-containing protein
MSLPTRPSSSEETLHEARALQSADRGDFETVTSLGHQMSGSGGMFGLQAISDIGGALEHAAESAHNDASRKWVGQLSNYLDGIDTISESQSSLCAITY